MDGERKTTDCAECRQLRKAVAELRELVRSQAQRIESQAQRLSSLQSPLDEQRQAGKRQAGPFSKGPPKADPKPPGRQSCEAYGQHQRRAIPDKIDETYDVPLPPKCPHCGGVAPVDSLWNLPGWLCHRRFWLREFTLGEPLVPLAHR